MLVTISLGSNVGDRLSHLCCARDLLQNLAVAGSFRQSAIYQTVPIACPDDSPDFFNAVVAFDFLGSASELHGATQKIENQLGRQRSILNAPRTIDVDILTCGDLVQNEIVLILPHPRMIQRRFVLEPLCEILPELQLPKKPHPVLHYLHLLRDQDPLIKVYETW
jgi:2-amino-4-hydroxy-6-hydroxymethyldihydropteridine diphosphokinase